MRAMKYDGIDPTLLSKTQKKEDKLVDVEKREYKREEEETAKQTETGEGQTELEKNDTKGKFENTKKYHFTDTAAPCIYRLITGTNGCNYR